MGLALRGPDYSGITTSGMRCCSTPPGVLFIQITAQPPPPEHRTSGRQRFELFWSAGDTVELAKKLDSMRHPVRELSQDGGALLEWQLHKVYALLLSASRQDPHPAIR